MIDFIGLRASDRPDGRSHTRRGQATVELALVAPILLLLLGAILQFGLIFGAQIGVINATREAARNAAATTPTLTLAQADVTGPIIYKELLGTMPPPAPEWLPKNVMAYDSSAVATTTRVCYSSYTDPSGLVSIQVTVTTDYAHKLFIPLVANIIDAIDGSPDGRYTLTSSETIRVANQPQLSTYTGGGIPAAPGGVCYP